MDFTHLEDICTSDITKGWFSDGRFVTHCLQDMPSKGSDGWTRERMNSDIYFNFFYHFYFPSISTASFTYFYFFLFPHWNWKERKKKRNVSEECSEMVFFPHLVQTQIVLDTYSNWENFNFDAPFFSLFFKFWTAELEVGAVWIQSVSLQSWWLLYWPTAVEKSQWLLVGLLVGWLVGLQVASKLIKVIFKTSSFK